MPELTLSPRWRAIAGHVYGLPQPALLGEVFVAGARPGDAAALDGLLSEWVAPPRELPPIDDCDAALALVSRLAFWTGEVQRHARMAAAPQWHISEAAADGERRSFELALCAAEPHAGVATLALVQRAVSHLLDTSRDAVGRTALASEFTALDQKLRASVRPGFNRPHLLLAAYRRGIAVQDIGGGVVRLGSGAQARLMQSTISDHTPALAMNLAQDKWMTARMLRTIGLPATHNQRVADAAQALELAQRWGWPVVIKPADLDQGRGVFPNLRAEAALREAFAAAQALSPRVLLERHVEGFGHRFTVHDGEVIAVLKRIPGGVTGDGRQTVGELLAQQLELPEVKRSLNLGRVSLDDEALALLAAQGLDAGQVPEAGRFVRLRRSDNLSAGGRLQHLDPATVHPDNLRAVLRAAQALYLDIAGVDFISRDITQSWRSNGAVICEVNARPQFGPGATGLNYDRLLDRLLGEQPRTLVHLLLCPDPAAPTLLDTLRVLRRRLNLQTLACRRGVWVDGVPHAGRCRDGFTAARAALADRQVRSLLFALAPSEVVARGLPIHRIDALHLAPGPWPEAELALREQAVAWCACPNLHDEAAP